MGINTKQGIAPLAAIIIALLVLGSGGYGIKKGVESRNSKKEKEKAEQQEAERKVAAEKEQKEKEVKMARVIHVKLVEQNKSGQKGEAIIKQTGTSTVKVIVITTGKPSGVAQPAHIHLGACPAPGAVKYPLTDVGKGASQTEIQNLTFDDLLSGLPLAINVHKSSTAMKTYTSCGDITTENVAVGEEKMNENEKGMEKKDTSMKSDQGAAAVTAIPKETVVTYNASGFSPQTITIKKGETVVFQNKTGKSASVASNPHPIHTAYPEFDQYKTDQKGKDEFRFTFLKVGTWGYHDHLNASNGGTVVVTE